MHISTNIDGSDHQQKSKNTAKIRIKLTIKCTFKTVPFERFSRPRFSCRLYVSNFRLKAMDQIVLEELYWMKFPTEIITIYFFNIINHCL